MSYVQPMTMTERARYIQRLRLDDPDQTPDEMHTQMVQEQQQRQLRQITNSTALSQRIGLKRGEPVARDF